MPKGCSKCGTPNADEARFCRVCGAAFDVETAAPEALAQPVEAPCRACGHHNRAGVRFCTRCGADQTPPAPVSVPPPADIGVPPPAAEPVPPALAPHATAAPRRRAGLRIGLVAIGVALTGSIAWWLTQSRPQAPQAFDAAPPPSMLGASGPTASASLPVVSAATTSGAPEPSAASTPSASSASSAAAAASSLWEPIDDTADALPSRPPARTAVHASAPVPRRTVAAPPRAPAPAPAPAAARTAQAHCANRNPILQGICESRECARAEHAGELVCQRIKAADDRRRQQEGGG